MVEGFLRVAAVSPASKVADVKYNVECILDSMNSLEKHGVNIAVFPELCITGYSCGDLFHSATLLDAAEAGLKQIMYASRDFNLDVIVGLPLRRGNQLYNCAALVQNGNVQIVYKTYLPAYNEFYESRWFSPSPIETPQVFLSHGVKIGIEICEDLWAPIPPSSYMALEGATVVFNLSASNDLIGKYEYLGGLIKHHSAKILSAYVYSSCGFGESTTDTAYLPKTIIAESGKILAENNSFDFLNPQISIAEVDIAALNYDRMHNTTFGKCSRRTGIIANGENGVLPNVDELLFREISRSPFVPKEDNREQVCKEISSIQISGLAKRLSVVGSNKVVIGISGGLDSTLALLVAHATIKKMGGDVGDIVAVTMPGFGTSGRTYENALALMKQLGVTMREVSIVDAVKQHFIDIAHDINVHDVTYENSQARERTQILMDIANQVGGIVLGTGDLSELALGWCTYNGDHMSMYGINASIPKTLMQTLVRWYAEKNDDTLLSETLFDIVDTPISPELTPTDKDGEIAQKTEEVVGPYELSDFFLYYNLRYGFKPRRVFELAKKAFGNDYENKTIIKWMRKFYWRFFSQQFKRSCLPDGPKIGSVCLSPRADWRMPSDASSALWIREVDELEREL